MKVTDPEIVAPLRTELAKITATYTGDDVGKQITAVRSLRTTHPHGIDLVAEAVPEDPSTFRYTCFQHAFELVNPPPGLITIASLYPEVFPNADFINHLIADHLAEVAGEDVIDNERVIYFDEGQPRHAGIVKSDQVISKWGTAHPWRHGLFEVPSGYGSRVRFFRPIDQATAHWAFLEYAHYALGNEIFYRLFPDLRQ